MHLVGWFIWRILNFVCVRFVGLLDGAFAGPQSARDKKLRCTRIHTTKRLEPTITMTELVDALWSMPTSFFLSFFLCCGTSTQCGSWPPHSWGFLDHTQRRTTVGRTPLNEWSARRRYLYLTTHNTHNRQTSMPPVGFEPTISACERPQTYALDRAATGTGSCQLLVV